MAMINPAICATRAGLLLPDRLKKHKPCSLAQRRKRCLAMTAGQNENSAGLLRKRTA
jgi:hypothetical protein